MFKFRSTDGLVNIDCQIVDLNYVPRKQNFSLHLSLGDPFKTSCRICVDLKRTQVLVITTV